MRSAPTKRMISPWMMIARLEARSGGKKAGSRFRDAVPVSRAANRSAARPTPTAVFRPSSATAMPMKPIVRALDRCDVEAELPPEDVEGAREPGEEPGDGHREEVVLRDADPAVARSFGVEADRSYLVAERRAVERERVHDQGCDGHEDPDVQALEQRVAPEDRELRGFDDVLGRGNGIRDGRLERPADAEEERPDPDDDPVQHDRRDHLVGSDRPLEEAPRCPPGRRRRASHRRP